MIKNNLSAPKKSFHAALFLILIGVCAALHIWKLPPALPSLQHELGLDLVESGFLLSSVQIAGMLLGLITGLFAERIGLRRCILLGLGILTLSSLGATFFQIKAMMMVSRAIEGFGFLMVVLPIPALIKRIVHTDIISRVMGLWGSYMPLGAVIILLTGSWLLSISSWRVLWLILAGLTLLMFLLSLFIIPDDRKMSELSSTGKPVLRLSTLNMLRTTLSSRYVWMIGLIFSAYTAQWSAIIGFLPTIYAIADISGPTAGLLTALVAGSNVVGNLVAGKLLQQGIRAQKLLITGFLIMISSAFIAFGTGQGVVVQFCAVVMFSVMGGLIPATVFLLAVTFAPSAQTTASTIGWVQQCSSMGQFLGPPIVAWVVSLLGGWQWAWIGSSAFAVLGILMTFFITTNQSKPQSS